jgi:acid phosphatase type 7
MNKNIFKICLVNLLFLCSFNYSLYANDTLIYFAKSTLIPGSSWKYLDNNTNLNSVPWKDSLYNDAAWSTGNSELGYGDGDENTIVNDGCTPQGSGCGTKFITTYFRKTFFVTNPSAYTSFLLQYKRDDGIEIFINGIRYEINNLTDPVLQNTLAAAAGDDGETVLSISIPTSAFFGTNKKNVIAVDVHQTLQTSSDITFDLQLIGLTGAILTRGPYLQMGKQDSISIRWRTDIATDTKVSWGSAFGAYPFSHSDATLTTEHELRIGTLLPDTKYFYTIGGTAFTLQADNTNYFLTAPPDVPNRKLRFIAVGDCGNASTNQINVKNTYLNYIGTNNTDAMILLGDNAYSFGTDAEYQAEFFDIYKDDLLKNIKLYPAPGNHDYGNTQANANVRNNAYYNNFTMPTAGQIGGLPSGTEAYYSFNIGNVHFIALDSYGKENANTTRLYDTLGAQVVWLKNDLAANTKTWTVVYFHHPPYTKTSHTSDSETELVLMRENFIRILERFGVDVVLCGHSHGYERSYLLKGYYNNAATPLLDADFNAAAHTATGNIQNAKYDGTALACPYTYSSGKINHGTVYTVAGSAGQLGGTTAGYPHDAMFYSNETNGGLLYFEVDNNRLDAKFVSYNTAPTPSIKDQFTIFKDVNKVSNITVNINTPLILNASWSGSYYWPFNATNLATLSVPTNAIGVFNYIVKDAASNNCLKDSFRVTVEGVLPINRIDYTVLYNNNKVDIKWQTTQEINCKEYVLEKSVDGVNFNFFKTLPANGFINQTKQYSAVDFAPNTGANYYRLSLIENDGRKEIIGVKKINADKQFTFSYIAIPVSKEQIQLIVNDLSSQSFFISLYDMSGQKIMSKKVERSSYIQLKTGLYFIKLMNESGKIITGKIKM